MPSTRPVHGDAAAADSSEAQLDVLDTAEAGPSVIRGSLLRVGGNVLGTLVTVASSAVVIRHLGVIDTGRFLTVTALVTIVAGVSDLGLTAIAVREYSVKPREDGRRFLRNLLGIRLMIVGTALAGAIVFAAAVNYTSAMVLGTVIAGLGMVLFVVQDSLSIPLQVSLRLGWVAGLQLAIQVGVAVEAVLLALAGAGLLPFFALQLPVVLPVLVVTTVVGGRDARVLPAVDLREWRRMLGRIVPFSVAVVLSILYFRIAQIMVSLLSSPTQTGYFGVGFRVLDTVTTIPGLLAASALPVLARSARDDAKRFAYVSRRLAESMMSGGFGLALAVFLGAGFAVDVVAGPAFEPAVDVLRILSIALLGTFVLSARGYALLALDRLRAVLVCNALAFAVVVGAGVPLIHAMGARGAAIALVAAELTLAVGYEVALSATRPEVRMPIGFVVRVVAAALAASLLATVLSLPSIIAAIVGVAAYAAALLALGVVPTELLEALRRRARPPATGTGT
jgi:O-antigen/teichoic acid export membrane protein